MALQYRGGTRSNNGLAGADLALSYMDWLGALSQDEYAGQVEEILRRDFGLIRIKRVVSIDYADYFLEFPNNEILRWRVKENEFGRYPYWQSKMLDAVIEKRHLPFDEEQ